VEKSWKEKLIIKLVIVLLPALGCAQNNQNSFEVYGYILTDAGYNFNALDPVWFDVMRPSKLPRYKGEFGPDGNYFISVRQSRFGVRAITHTKMGELKTQFDFDFFGFGKDVGQTTIHVVNAFGELGKFLAGQTPSTFMDTDVFPVTLDYWGPSSRIFFLNIQVRYTPINTAKERMAFALERPGGTADGTDYSNSVEIENVGPRFLLPNAALHYRYKWKWGHTQVAGLVKFLGWKDQSDTSALDLSGGDVGWGVNFSTVINAARDVRFKLQAQVGEGFENYIADSSPDVSLEANDKNSISHVKGKALPVWGFFCFTEIDWTKRLKSSAGYSFLRITNSDLQSPDAFKMGQYALINLRCYPVENFMLGIEYQHGRRTNFTDDFHSFANKIQCSFKYNFSYKEVAN
jgi:hypothetical protein